MDRDLFNAVLRTDFYSFVRRVFREIAAGETLVENWHIEAMCFALGQVALGYRRRQIIEVPPRSLNSMCASVALTAWILGHNPTRKIICVSYSQLLSGRFSAMTRQVMKSDWYKEVFPRTRISPQKDTEEYFRTTAGGYRDATSVGGTLTGKGGDLIIIDDPAKPNEMMSEAQRNAVNNWYDQTLVSRLNNKAKDSIVLVMQRLHPDDLAGHVKEGEPWHVLKIPAIATIESEAQIGTERWHSRAKGDILNPAHEPLEELLRLKERMGSNAFSAQYQQDPLPADGSIVEWAWFRCYDRLPSDMRIVQSWDCASKAGEFNDYSVCMTWGVVGTHFYLIDILRKRMLFPELLRMVESHAHCWQAKSIVIEDSAAGTQVIQSMRFDRSPRVPLPIPITPERDKQTRLHAVSAIIEQGRAHLPIMASWLEEFRIELIQFPFGRHDDQVDCMSQFLGHMQKEQRSGARAEHRPMFAYK